MRQAHIILQEPYSRTICKLHVWSIIRNYIEQGSHSTWKTWKNETTPGKPGNIMEFWKI